MTTLTTFQAQPLIELWKKGTLASTDSLFAWVKVECTRIDEAGGSASAWLVLNTKLTGPEARSLCKDAGWPS